jgi:hypothetical protein
VDVQDTHQLPGPFAVYQLSDRWLLIAPDSDGPHGGWLRLSLSERELSSDCSIGGYFNVFNDLPSEPPGPLVGDLNPVPLKYYSVRLTEED